jgi:hypothetical protein
LFNWLASRESLGVDRLAACPVCDDPEFNLVDTVSANGVVGEPPVDSYGDD